MHAMQQCHVKKYELLSFWAHLKASRHYKHARMKGTGLLRDLGAVGALSILAVGTVVGLTSNCCPQISFVEIHQDDVRDLLGDGENYAPIHVRESPERGTYLENAQ